MERLDRRFTFLVPTKNTPNEFYLFVCYFFLVCFSSSSPSSCSLVPRSAYCVCVHARRACVHVNDSAWRRRSDSALLNFCHCWSFNSIFTQSYHCHSMSSLKSHQEIYLSSSSFVALSHQLIVRMFFAFCVLCASSYYHIFSSHSFIRSFHKYRGLSPVGCWTASHTHTHMYTQTIY